MSPSAQVVFNEKIALIQQSGRFPSLLEFGVARRDADAEAMRPANDDVLTLDQRLAGADTLDEMLAILDAEDERATVIPAPANDDQAPAPAAPLNSILVTKKGRARRAKSHLRDREDAESRRTYRKGGTSSAVAGKSASSARHLTPPTPSHTNTTTTTKTKRGRTKTSRTRLLASWDKAGDMTRLGYVNDALALHGDRYAFTLNLSPDVIRTANDNARGPVDHYRREIARQLVKVIPDRDVPMWFVLETTEEGRQHLHGAIALNDNDVPAVRQALKKAGGTWVGHGRGHQLDLAPQRLPDAWAAYPVKMQARTRRHVREAIGLDPDAAVPITSWSRCLIVEAKRLLADERQAIGRR